MFERILIANRGEIACRVIRTARALGIWAVAVHSDADRDARHVRMADQAVAIGTDAARRPYLDIGAILDAARRTGAQAIHPGYGFLSENAEFADACARSGIAFIGPPAEAIRAMGSKDAAKAMMERAGVPVTPGYHGADQDAALLAEQAARIGYPVLIKASAGGGGKGMRRVDRPADFAGALASCRREAAAAFGDDRVLVEKYIERPRHIEFQVFGDSHGNYVHLFERDCSVQRRHQKILEEAPAPGMTAQRRASMGHAAVEAARAVGYVGAGTVEFIVRPDGEFYFMEMNTRLQVEHPVTEMITGLDLVEWQLRIAAGQALPLPQEAIPLRGHALEARIYAEDPDKDFLPSTGMLRRLAEPRTGPDVRVDSGVEQGDAITPHYDPMIAKLIVRGDDRPQALARMRQALAQYRIAGVANNVDFLSRLVATPAFAQGDIDTGLIEREAALLFAPRQPPEEAWLAVALAEVLRARAAASPLRRSPWEPHDGWRLNGPAERRMRLRHGGSERAVLVRTAEAGYELELDGRTIAARGELDSQGELSATLGADTFRTTVLAEGSDRLVFLAGRTWRLADAESLPGWTGGDEAPGGLSAPMPGKVLAVLAEPGRLVEPGQPLLILEAMKMEHAVAAPRRGKVVAFRVAPGDLVAEGDELVDFETEPA